MTTINPYLNFNGNCEEAFHFYRDVFGGEFADFQRFTDMPSEGQAPAEEAEWIMHVSLPVGPNAILMGSDRPSAMGEGTFGNNFNISVQTDDAEEADRLFDGLSAGGQATMPLQ
jgi:PhnB protein